MHWYSCQLVFFTVLWIISISLNLSSQYIYETQTLGRSYKYDIQLEEYQQPYQSLKGDSNFYLNGKIGISWRGNVINQQAIGFHKKNEFVSTLYIRSQGTFLTKR